MKFYLQKNSVIHDIKTELLRTTLQIQAKVLLWREILDRPTDVEDECVLRG
jgi:hypothetical protein